MGVNSPVKGKLGGVGWYEVGKSRGQQSPAGHGGALLLQRGSGRRKRSDGEAVVVPFDALGDAGQERVFLGVLDYFGQAVVDGPGAAAHRATVKGFIKSVGMEADSLVLLVFAYGALHGVAPFALPPCSLAYLVNLSSYGCQVYSGKIGMQG